MVADRLSSREGPDRHLLGWFAAGSLAAVLLGAATMAASDVAASRWVVNIAGWVAGAVLAAVSGLYVRPGKAALKATLCVATLMVLASLLGPAQSGVHRWITAGPLVINAAALALPSAIIAGGSLRGSGLSGGCALLIATALALQPDASQSLALTAACLVLLWPLSDGRGRGLALALIALSVAAAIRPDPLQPVPDVEQIVTLAHRVSPLLAAAMALALATSAAVPLLATRRRAGRALAAYSTIIMFAPLCGWFPVPLAGSGVSFVIGLWLGAGLLASASTSDGIE